MNGTKKLNFGCGRDIKKGYINVDRESGPGVDRCFDFNIFPYPFSGDEFGHILADNVLEHLDDIPRVMKELHRIARPGGTVRIIVPHYNSYGAYNDVTHKHYFSHLAFEPFYSKNTRGNYALKEEFELQKIRLVPTRFGKIFLLPRIQKITSYFIGQVIQAIDLTLTIKK